MKIFNICFVIIFTLQSCDKSEKDIAGVYLKTPSVHTIDSLFIYADSLQSTNVYNRKVYNYTQCFYNKKTNELLFKNSNSWWFEDGNLKMMNFYFDTDNDPSDYVFSKKTINSSVILFSTSFEGNDIILDKGIYYRKIE